MGTWRWRICPSDAGADLLGVHVWNPRSAIAVGRGGACVELDGQTWRSASLENYEDLYAVWGSASGDVFAVGGDLKVGGQSLVCERRRGSWRQVRSSIQSLLLSVSGRASDEVRAVGFNGGIVERAADGWRELSAQTHEHLFCVRALSSGQWALCGINGLLQTTTAGVWSAHRTSAAHLTSLTELPRGRIVAVGFAGTIFALDGPRCEPIDPLTNQHLWAVCTAADAALAVGAAGTLLLCEAGTWRRLASPTSADLFAVSAVDDFAVAVGKDGLTLLGERV